MACFATGPALGMFEVYGRTGPQTLGEGAQFWTLEILYILTCQFERLRRLDYGTNTCRY